MAQQVKNLPVKKKKNNLSVLIIILHFAFFT